MIIKIERYAANQEYWLLDGIRKISVSKPLMYETEKERDEAGTHDACFLDLIKCTCVVKEKRTKTGCSNCVDHNTYNVRRLICRLEDGNEYSILFDTIVYVLNDKGKTIEKIVANYND
ncbi:MAG: hypothetical protein ACFFG0_01030 [Candidatus Thorarchaeota archaeon]